MVGLDDELIQLMDVLTGQQSCRQIISIVGMGGIGKTTLARNVYENLLVMQHFDFRAWATLSQEYIAREVLLQLLSCNGKYTDETDDELGELLYKSLSGRRYLITLDDMWSIEVWDKLKIFFPDNGNGSRVILTTRLSNVASHCGSCCFKMNFLDEDKLWNLFCEKVFGHEDCPTELEKIGKKIVKLCKGLPLSIIVIGGLLRKSHITIGYWQTVAENINSILNSGENEQCLNTLSISYSHLPAHLKPCFLYVGSFQEDREIRVSQIIKLWVAEGIIKPNGAQILENIAEGYLMDLIQRNLVLIGRCRKNGKVRTCQIHDLLRDLCIRVAQKEKLFYVLAKGHNIPQGIEKGRRLICHDFISNNSPWFDAVQSATLARSLICGIVFVLVKYRLMRVLNTTSIRSHEVIFNNFNLRFLAFNPWQRDSKFELHSSVSLVWNLQTLITNGRPKLIIAPPEIWEMPQLRHVQCNKISLPDPPPSDGQEDLIVLKNLRTLSKVVNFRLTEEVCKRIPTIKKLRINYDNNVMGHDECWYYYLSNLGHLRKLESLTVKFFPTKVSCWNRSVMKLKFRFRACLVSRSKNLTFPTLLNKLSLKNCGLRWEDLTIIGSLPRLKVLKLQAVVGSEWSTVEGGFICLKFLSIRYCNVRTWNADSAHFPVLKKLVVRGLWGLNEIPWGIGEIPTLRLIRVVHCNESVAISAMKIKEEQENLGNNGLQIEVMMTPFSSEKLRKGWK